MCSGFSPPQAARVTVVSGETGLWVVWYNSDVVRLMNKGGKSAMAEFKYVLWFINVWWWALILRVNNVWWWALILSLRSGEGIDEGIPELMG